MSTTPDATGTQAAADLLVIDSMMPVETLPSSTRNALRLRPSKNLALTPLEQTSLEREQAAMVWQGTQIAPEDAQRYRQEIDKADRGLLMARKQSLAHRAEVQRLQTELDQSRQLSLAGPVGLGALATVGLVGWLYQRKRLQQLQAQVRSLQQQDHTGSTLPSMLSEDVPG